MKISVYAKNRPETIRLALRVADEAARSDIECFCAAETHSGRHHGHWYDLKSFEPQHKEWVDRAVRYLTLRGLLKRHPDNERLVRPLSPKDLR